MHDYSPHENNHQNDMAQLNEASEDAMLRDALAFIDTFDPVHDLDDTTTIDVWGAFNTSSHSFPSDASPRSLTSIANLPSSPCSSSSETTLTTIAKPRAPRRNRAHWYLKRRNELQYLRDLVAELEHRLGHLQQRTLKQETKRTYGTIETGKQSLVESTWEELVRRQFKQRQRAEAENLKLKKVLKDQIHMIQGLQRLMTKKRTSEMESVLQRSRFDHPVLSLTSYDSISLFSSLFGAIQSKYSVTDQMLMKIRHTCPTVNHYDVRLVQDPTLGLVVETMECRILPFPYEATVEAAWDSVADGTNYGPHLVEKTQNEQKCQVQVNQPMGTARLAMNSYVASRRYTETTRTVIVSTGVSDPSEISGMKMDGVHMRYESWIIVSPLARTEKESTIQSATRMTRYVVAIPTVSNSVEDHEDITHKTGTLLQFFVDAHSYNRERSQETLENRLFERSVQSVEMIA